MQNISTHNYTLANAKKNPKMYRKKNIKQNSKVQKVANHASKSVKLT